MRLPFTGDEVPVVPVTLVVAVLDDAAQLPDLLCGIERQTLAPAEFLIADRGSIDGTAQLLNDWSPPPLLSFKVIGAAGTTVAEARNLAIESASQDSIVVTEAAGRPDPTWISLLWATLSSGAVVVSGRARPTGSTPLLRAIALVRTSERRRPGRAAASGANLAFVKSVWDDVGGYPEWLKAGHDEVFAAALRAAGTCIADVPDAVVSWGPEVGLRGFATDSFRTARACGQAGLFPSPGAVTVGAAGALLAGACVRRSFGLVVAGTIAGRAEKSLRTVRRSRADAVDPLGVRIALTVGVRLLGDVSAVVGYAVGLVAALRAIDPVKVLSDDRTRAARYRSGFTSLRRAPRVPAPR